MKPQTRPSPGTGNPDPGQGNATSQLLRYAEDLSTLLEAHQRLMAKHEALKNSHDQTHETETALQQILQDNRNLHVITDPDGQVTHTNPAAAFFLGVASAPGKRLVDLLPSVKPGLETVLQSTISPRGKKLEVEIKNTQGSLNKFTVHVIPGQDSDGNVNRLHWLLYKDLSEEEDEQLWTLSTAVFNNANEGIMVTDPDGIILAVNPAFSRITGYPAREVIGETPKLISSGIHDARFFERLWSSLNTTGQWQGEVHNRHKNGEIIIEWLSITASKNAQGLVDSYIGVFSDVSAIVKAEKQLEHIANYDHLTQLPNRNLFLDRLNDSINKAKRSGESFGLMFIDLDGFKSVNDRHGHAFGDVVLKEAARRMSLTLRESDTVARYGGDEFVILIHGLTGEPDISKLSRKLISAFSPPILHDGKEACIGLSIGCAQYPQHAEHGTELLQVADTAMYAAKSAGGNRHVVHQHAYHPIHPPPRNAGLSIEKFLETRRVGVRYQPQFDLTCQPPCVSGVEALLHGRTPTEAGSIFDEAEHNDLAGPLSTWVLHTTCRQLGYWLDNGIAELRLSINIAPGQLNDSGLIDETRKALASLESRGVNPHCPPLEFTISDQDAIPPTEGNRERLLLLRRLGIGLVMANFDSACFSLRRLANAPLTGLKIGAETVREMGRQPTALALCQSATAIGTAFRLDLVAKGIETTDQLKRLRGMGFTHGQGPLLGWPMPADAFKDWWFLYHGEATTE
jgi:diguanylate cyclase (GGDEF)-like protein/PAS domain S-box-containing protein